MIVPMKKATIIVREQDAPSAVSALRSLGVMHVEHVRTPQGEDITGLKEELTLITSAINILSDTRYLKLTTGKQEKITDWKFVAKHISDLNKRLQQLEDYSRVLLAKIAEWQRWGDFDPGVIEEFKKRNIFVGLYQVPVKEFDSLPAPALVKKIFTLSGFTHCVIISHGKLDVPFKEISLPKMGLEDMRKRLYEEERMRDIIVDDICKYLVYRQGLINKKAGLEKQLELREAVRGMGQEKELSYICGYVPQDTVERFLAEAKPKQWGIIIDEPLEDDLVPVLLRNPRWVSLIRPVFKFLEILPGYRELDVSLMFLVFFSIFFGILIGDAGYGLVYFLLTAWLHRKKRKSGQDTNTFYLFYILSGCAIIWGLLTGTFFGQEWFIKAGYKPLAPVLNDEKGMQRFCFFVGALHLSIAHGWRAVLKFPSLAALSDIGWICILWDAFFLACNLILGEALPQIFWWLLVPGIILPIVFYNLQSNIIRSIGQGLGNFLLSIMNNFTDVVSYVRLFAVGLAGVAIADAFNAMGGLVGFSNPLTIIVSILIVVIGHTLGLVLGPVSVLVHGVRLNVLEFSGHAGISWCGEEYKPLTE